MLNIRVNSKALLQLDVAATYYAILPNRVQQAQAEGMMLAKKNMKSEISHIAKAAKYLEYELVPYGPVGMILKIKPSSKVGTKKNGSNPQIGSAILLTGKKGGGFIRPKKRGRLMKTRKISVMEGYEPYYAKVRKVAIPSKKRQIREVARRVILNSLRQAFTKQGFGTRGGVRAPSTDVVR